MEKKVEFFRKVVGVGENQRSLTIPIPIEIVKALEWKKKDVVRISVSADIVLIKKVNLSE